MRVIDLAAQLLIMLRGAPKAVGSIDASDGRKYYISPANPSRHIIPTPPTDAKAVKFRIDDL